MGEIKFKEIGNDWHTCNYANGKCYSIRIHGKYFSGTELK